ncbi:MAG: glycosyltransferase family 39 protein [Verrucomicrobia bacterium]|nr:glycosyltransferase family 39 protein [Verrucomicrobiota bacterium]
MANAPNPQLQGAASRKSFWWVLLLGVALRLVAVNQPLIDAHLFRQTQTADATKSLIEEPGWHLSAKVSWKGDTGARLCLEFPLYNYLVMAVHVLTGNLDASGKLVSVALWGFSFWLLQGLWRRVLDDRQSFWANLLFVLSPLEVFFGQAFMPEMLVQSLAFGFLLAALRYMENPSLPRWIICAATGLLGLLVKAPEIAHWYLVLLALLFEKERWRCAWRPRYVMAAIISLLVIRQWSLFMAQVNHGGFAELASTKLLLGSIGPWWARFGLNHYRMIAQYLAILAFSITGMMVAALGLLEVLRSRTSRFALYWLGALALYYLIWAGPVSSGQSYYNLPALGPGCMLFGIGMVRFLTWLRDRWGENLPARFAKVAVLAVTLSLLAAGTLYLFRQDRVVYESALWTREHTNPDELVLFKWNHRPESVDYPHPCVFSYYAQRRVWVYTKQLSEVQRQRAVATSRWAVVTQPPPESEMSVIEKWRIRIRQGGKQLAPDNMDWLEQDAGFVRFYEGDGFTVYRKQS